MATDVVDLAFDAMGTDGRVVVVGGRDPFALGLRALAWIAELEARWSRFRPDSDIARLNRSEGEAVAVGSETIQVMEDAVEAWRRTDARYDPTVHDALVAAGYDRTFDALVHPADGDDGEQDVPVLPGSVDEDPVACAAPGCVGIDIDRRRGEVRLPPGVHIDLGGIGKGAAADLVVGRLLESGAWGGCVDIGGDVRVLGDAPTPAGWVIGAPDAVTDGPLVLADGGCATSGVRRRRWIQGGAVRHHLLDPATGRSVDNELAAVTVVAAAARWAEALTKAAFVAGLEDAPALVVEAGAEGWFVGRDGTCTATPGAAAYCWRGRSETSGLVDDAVRSKGGGR